MSGCCEHDACASSAGLKADAAWRRALWIALVVNAGMFAAEVAAGFAADSSALQADALDFLGDAANYAISLGVAGLGLDEVFTARRLDGGRYFSSHLERS